jgi:trehalose 6-phosphate synthase/phosphatase
MSRLLIVSNRLPVTTTIEAGKVRVELSSGGLATGLSGPFEASRGLWIGWPGPTWSLDEEARATLDADLAARRLVPLHLSADEIERYYENFSNGLLWPLFHYMLDRMPLRVDGWEAYERVNQKFAEAVAREWRTGDQVWVHDYQLMLVPGLVRALVPDARIGFFLHIPFPASAVLRALPHREALLRGLLGADLIGLHTASYVRHLAAALLRVLGVETRVDRAQYQGREVRIGPYPMGVDAQSFAALGADPDIQGRASAVLGSEGCRLLVGIDRLDYTKGIARRLLAYEELLRTNPDLHGRVRLLQVAVPSRGGVHAYREVRQSIDGLVGRIQGQFATPTWSPVHYMHRNLAREEVAALYRAADVLLVTPIRDGMNLVAKEFVATRVDEDGVLVLSEFAGAASELAGAILVNPYDVEATAAAIRRALDLSREERRARMRLLRARVNTADVHDWSSRFLSDLDEESRVLVPVGMSSPAIVSDAVERAGIAAEIVLLLDYDGTLVPFAPSPMEAVPDAELVTLLGALARGPKTHVHLVSGRPREDLELWFGSLPIGLHAEHGLWSRSSDSRNWRRAATAELARSASIEAILQDWTARTPGTFVERKSSVLAWHWRGADPERGPTQERDLRLHLAEMLSNEPVEVVVGDHVVEVRPQGVHKGLVLAGALGLASEGALAIALGDDRTDEDMFAALGREHMAVHIGPNASVAGVRLADSAAAREFLRAILLRRQERAR